jgi:hypothetical protein
MKKNRKSSQQRPKVAAANYRWCKLELDRNQGNLLRSLSAGLPLEGIPAKKQPEDIETENSWPIILFTLVLFIPIIWSRSVSCIYLSSIPFLLVIPTLAVKVTRRLLEPDEEQSQAFMDEDFLAEDEADEETSTSLDDTGKSSPTRSRTHRSRDHSQASDGDRHL